MSNCTTCAANGVCPYYSADMEASMEECGEVIAEYIEAKRDEYIEAWGSYLSDCGEADDYEAVRRITGKIL